MLTVVYQGSQSQLIDSRTLKLKLASQKPNFCPSFELDLKPRILDSSSSDSSFKLMKEKHFEDVIHTSTNNLSSSIIPNLGGWTFLQTLTNSIISSQQTPKEIKETSYVHPLAKTSPTSFGFKGLELCTENLGSETGTELVEDDVVFSFTPSDSGNVKSSSSCSRRIQTSFCEGKKKIKTFPPPLTTMSGSDCLRVRPHREDGRLVINAVKTPIKSSCFQAERSHGSLRLRFVDNNNSNGGTELDTTTSDENDDKEQNVVAKSEDHHHGNGKKFANDDQLINNEIYQDEAEKEQEEDNNNNDALCKVEDMDGNKLEDSVAKMGIGKLHRQSSRIICMCKEGGNRNKDGLLSLEACWLATSS